MKGLSFQIYVKKVLSEFKEKNPYTKKYKTKYEFDKGDGCLSIQNSKRNLDEVMEIIDKVLRPHQKQTELIGRPKLSFRIQVFKVSRKFSQLNKKTRKKETKYDKKSKNRSLYDMDILSQPQLNDLIKKALKSTKEN